MLTPKQESLYWRTWARICTVQGWSHLPASEKDARRKQTHIIAGLKLPDGSARSMKSFQNRDFSRWLSSTASLRDQVDIRDRDRENAEWTCRRLAEAIELLLGNDSYVRAIQISWRDTVDLDNFPLEDPLRFPRDERGQIDVRDAGRLLDLVNLRNTLKNRLGRIIQRIKTGEIQPGPECPKFYDYPQEHLISCLVNRVEIKPPAKVSVPGMMQVGKKPKRTYQLDSSKTFSPHVQAKACGSLNEPKVTPGELMSGNGIATACSAPTGNPAEKQGSAAPFNYCAHAVHPPTRKPKPQPVPEPAREPDPF